MIDINAVVENSKRLAVSEFQSLAQMPQTGDLSDGLANVVKVMSDYSALLLAEYHVALQAELKKQGIEI